MKRLASRRCRLYACRGQGGTDIRAASLRARGHRAGGQHRTSRRLGLAVRTSAWSEMDTPATCLALTPRGISAAAACGGGLRSVTRGPSCSPGRPCCAHRPATCLLPVSRTTIRPAAGTLAMTTGYPSPGRACASAPWPSRLPKRKLRVLSFVTRDKFQHRRLATLHCGEAALEGRDNLLRIGDFFTVRAHGLCHL